jgi:hypothetical protein
VPSARYGNWCIRNAHSIWGRTVGFDVESRTLFSSRDTTTITSSSRHFHHHHSTTSSISRTADNYPTSNSPSSRATCLRLKALDHKSYPRGLFKEDVSDINIDVPARNAPTNTAKSDPSSKRQKYLEQFRANALRTVGRSWSHCSVGTDPPRIGDLP